MSSAVPIATLVAIRHRLLMSRPQQFRPHDTVCNVNPISGHRIHFIKTRKPANRRTDHEDRGFPVADCFFCRRRTPSTIFSVRYDGSVVVPDEAASFALAERALMDLDPDDLLSYREISRLLAPGNHTDDDTLAVRVFANQMPAMVSSHDHCLVVALADPRWHGLSWSELPVAVVTAYMRALQVLEELAQLDRMTPLSFINQGRAAGASVPCPHAQVYLLASTPPTYHAIEQHRLLQGRCGVCEVLSGNLIAENATMRLVAHPAPLMNLSLLAAPRRCNTAWLSNVPASDLADTLVTALGVWRCGPPITDYNVLLRTGEEVNHLHLEFVPRQGLEVNTPAGFELSSGESIISYDPEQIALRLVS